MKRFSLILIACVTGCMAWAQNGFIQGTVTETDNNNEPAFGAIVSVDSTKFGAPCDFDGKYKISLPAGTYSVSCKYTGYAPITITEVVVSSGKTTPLDFQLTRAAILMGDTNTGFVVIYAERPKEAVAPLLEEIKQGNGAVDGTTSNEIKKTTSTDAGQVARRIPGVTLVDNRFIIVRGLSERYNSVLLNNVLAPSVESDVKAFSFNLVPAPMIERFLIYKSPAPNLPGEFAGGVVKLTTTDIPAQTSLVIGYATGYRSGTTFEPFHLNKGGTSDLFGFGAKSRALPAGFPANVRDVTEPVSLQAIGRSLPNSWSYQTKNAPVDHRFNATYSLRVSKPKYQFGNITSVNYSNTYQSMISNRADYNTFDTVTMHSDTIFNYYDYIYQNSVRVALVQNNALRFGKAGQHRINLKNLVNQMGDNETTQRTGANMEFGANVRETAYRYTQRFVYTGQLVGEHSFNDERTKLDWTVAYSAARRQDPDWRRVRYTQAIGSSPDEPYTVYIPFQAQPFYMGRLFIEMQEDIYAGAVNFEQLLTLGADSATKKKGYSFTVKAGGYYESKSRNYHVRNLGYKAASSQTYQNYDLLVMPIGQIFAEENINDTDGIELDEDTKKADQYYASIDIQAAYAMVVLPFGNFKGKTDEEDHERVRLSAGARAENSIQKLHGNLQNGDTVIVNNPILRILPSVNVAFNLTDRMLIRAAYGKTLNRPEFREISPNYFYDFIFNSINTGNPKLRTPSIDNYDLRWEFYPRPGENITVGAFYKKFVDPIEMYFIPGGGSGGTRSFTWGNATEAINWGLEMELRKKLDSVDVPVIRNLAIVANAAWISSKIDLDSISDDTRPMMGQSPWIINAGLFYQNDSIGLQVNAMYNVVGPRVVIVGVPGIPEVWEMPRHQLDFSIVKTLGKNKNMDVRLNVTDCINQNFTLLQDANDDGELNRDTDQLMQSYNRGTYFTLGFTVRLLEPKQN